MKILPFKMPEKIEIIEINEKYGKFIISPLERGFGITIGNALRRALLSSIQGYAITELKIDGILHEFSTIEGVYEDVPEIIKNLKQTRVKLLSSLRKKLYLKVKNKGEYKAKDIQTDSDCIIINPEHHILRATDDVSPFTMELTVTSGRGYVPLEMLKNKNVPIGTIFIDAIYSPVMKVNFNVEDTRVEERMDYNKLTLEIWTDGSIHPQDAVALASINLIKHFKLFEEIKKELKIEEVEELTEEQKKLLQVLSIKIGDLELSPRAYNCLKKANVETLGDLVQKTPQEMLQYPNFGKKSLQELIDLLARYNLTFGMNVKELLKTSY